MGQRQEVAKGAKSYGGYADFHRAPGHFVVRIPDGLDLALAAPMLCGGVTVFSPCASTVLEERPRKTSESSVLFTHPFSPIYSLPAILTSPCDPDVFSMHKGQR